MKENFNLTSADMVSIRESANGYLTSKGAKLYNKEKFNDAVEYYRLAAAMGEVQAIANLGYCYLYGRSIEPNVSLAIAYLTIAANQGNIDGAYKLGDIYSSDKWGVKDKELSLYYYNIAADYLIEDDWRNGYSIIWDKQLQQYPSLCLALAKEKFPGGGLKTDIRISYEFLKHAEKGYKEELLNGNKYYEESYKCVLEMLKKPEYDEIREEIDDDISGDYDDEDE